MQHKAALSLGFMLRQALGLQVGGHSFHVVGVGPRQVRQALVARLGVRGGVLEAVEDQGFRPSRPRANNVPLSLAAATCPGPSLSPCSWTAAHVAAYSSTGPDSGRRRASHHQRLFTPRGERQAVREALDDYQSLRVRRRDYPRRAQQPPDAPSVRLAIFAPSFMRGRPSESSGINWTACTSGMPGHAAIHAEGGASNVTRAGPWGIHGFPPSSG